MMTLTENQISKAIAFWAAVIQNPKFDNGEQTMASTLAAMRVKPLTLESVNSFKQALEDTLRSAPIHTLLRCDYQPDRILEEVVRTAGVPASNCPWKTGMSFNVEGEVLVKYGYTAVMTVVTDEYLEALSSGAEQVKEFHTFLKQYDEQHVGLVETVTVNATEGIQEAIDLVEDGATRMLDLRPQPPEIPLVEEDSSLDTPEDPQPVLPGVSKQYAQEQLALWAFVMDFEAKRRLSGKPVEALRTALKKKRRETSRSKPFTRKVLKLAVRQPENWLVFWVADIFENSMDFLSPTNNAIHLHQQEVEGVLHSQPNTRILEVESGIGKGGRANHVGENYE